MHLSSWRFKDLGMEGTWALLLSSKPTTHGLIWGQMPQIWELRRSSGVEAAMNASRSMVWGDWLSDPSWPQHYHNANTLYTQNTTI